MEIIITNKSKSHMKVHQDDFIIEWTKLIDHCNKHSSICNLSKEFESSIVTFDKPIGYSSIIEVTSEDEIVYAKRKGRNTYTKFVKDKKKELVSTVVFILERKRKNKNKYYLITMFPGVQNYREPEDISIKTTKELKESLDFWRNHALVFDEKILKTDTLTYDCPYNNLYMSLY